jgi:hypothetical protein
VWARLWARVGEHCGESLLLKELAVTVPTCTDLTKLHRNHDRSPAPAPDQAASAPRVTRDGRDLSAHWSPGSLPSQLNSEWRQLCQAPGNTVVLAGWGRTHPALAGCGSLPELLSRICDGERAARDRVLLELLELSHEGDRLAGRVVLQAMLPKAVRLAMSIVRRPDVLGDQEEALARAVAAMWQVIATYPLTARPGRVSANLALDTLALVQRGHTGSSYFPPTFPEHPYADLTELSPATQPDPEPGDDGRPAEDQLQNLLAWAVRTGVLQPCEGQWMTRIYLGPTRGGYPTEGPAVAAELGISWVALRQRCHRLARRLGQAAEAAGISRTDIASGAVLTAA